MIYLDWAATAPVDPESLAVAADSYSTHTRNPSAIYQSGQAVSMHLLNNRIELAKALHCQADQIVFCSTATEANNIVITSFLNHTPAEIITSPLEHDSVYQPLQKLKQLGWKVIEAPIDLEGRIDVEKIPDIINKNTVAFFAMDVCNETGTVQPIQEIGMLLEKINRERDRRIHFHSDMVQALGKKEIDLQKMKVDSASFSAHKIGAIRGAAMLYLKKAISPLYGGGGQEKGIRSGTENVGAIDSFIFSSLKTIRQLQENQTHFLSLKRELIEGIVSLKKKAEIHLLPTEDPTRLLHSDFFSPHLLQIAIPPLPSEVLVRLFDSKGVEISGGSACASNSKKKMKRVSEAMQYDKRIAESTLRISFGNSTTSDEIKKLLQIIEESILDLAKKF